MAFLEDMSALPRAIEDCLASIEGEGTKRFVSEQDFQNALGSCMASSIRQELPEAEVHYNVDISWNDDDFPSMKEKIETAWDLLEKGLRSSKLKRPKRKTWLVDIAIFPGHDRRKISDLVACFEIKFMGNHLKAKYDQDNLTKDLIRLKSIFDGKISGLCYFVVKHDQCEKCNEALEHVKHHYNKPLASWKGRDVDVLRIS